MQPSPLNTALSVVVIGRNEGHRLTRCFESIARMAPHPDGSELIYVDSDSIDDSVSRAQAFGARIIRVKPQRPAAALARNAGWKAAAGDYILFLDGDTVLNPYFVNAALAEFSNPQIAAVCGIRREMSPQDSIYNRVLDLDWIYPAGPAEFFGGDVIVRRKILEDVDGYDSALIAGEEPELCRRIRAKGFQILRLDKSMTGHDLAIKNFSQYWRRAFRTGYAYAEVSRRFRQTPDPLWKHESRHNLIKGGLLLALPLLCLIAGCAFHTVLPVLVLICVFLLLAGRSAWLARKKSDDILTCVLYGFHAHLQHIPMFFGQLVFYKDLFTGRYRKLIEYKQ